MVFGHLVTYIQHPTDDKMTGSPQLEWLTQFVSAANQTSTVELIKIGVSFFAMMYTPADQYGT